jgi:RecJ-like exonuclease
MKGFSLGDDVSFTGVVISTKYFRGRAEHTMHTGDNKVIFNSNENIVKGEEYEISGKVSGLFPLKIGLSEITKTEGIYDKVLEKIESKTELNGFINENEVTNSLGDLFTRVAKKLASAKELNRSILLRFHNDADGIAGAFALGGVIKSKAVQQNSAIYSQRDVVNDMSYLYHEWKPLVILLDFASNEKSAKSLELLRASGAEIIVIDHHPIYKEASKIPHLFISPWLLDIKMPSEYTAGYLASEISHMLGGDTEKYARVACAGDKSEVMLPDEADIKTALVLDYLATNTVYGNNLAFYKEVLGKQELFSSIYLQAKEGIESAAEKARNGIKKREKGDFNIYVFSLSGVVVQGEFPNRSKVTTAVFEKVSGEKPTVVIGHGGGTLILRANREAVEKGLDLPKIISSVSENFADIVIGGGGHMVAAAMRVQQDYEQTIIDALIERFP